MRSHPEAEQLSAFVDAELSERDRTELEAHLSSCEECGNIIDALRATLADLSWMPRPQVDDETAWRIRSAVFREQRAAGRARRYGWIGGAAAASLVAILVFTQLLGGGSADKASGGGRERAALALRSVSGNLDEKSLAGLLNQVVKGRSSGFNAAADAAPGGAGSAQTNAPDALGLGAVQSNSFEAFSRNSVKRDSGDNPEVARAMRCLDTLRSSTQAFNLLDAGFGTYKRESVFIFFLEPPAKNPARIELWVTTRDSCTVRYFRQVRIPPP